ncbi:MAG: DHHA1 domain-containing protein [Arhodomonas sp.]|nr:DHHA1 domain-containing protein [Arhodomonas sp.]
MDALNRRRRVIEADMKAEAMEHVAEGVAALEGQPPPPVLCLTRPEWHQGVVGIVAARLKERFHRPAIVFAPDEDGQQLKGSARSIPGVHMRDLIERVDTLEPG